MIASVSLHITNLYWNDRDRATSGDHIHQRRRASAVKTININTWIGYSGSTNPPLDMTGGSNISIVNDYLSANNTGASIVKVTAGKLRITNGKIYPTLAGPSPGAVDRPE